MPLHGNLSLEHRRGGWSSALEFQAVDAKTDVEAVRNELPTPGYALLNIRSGYQWKLFERASMRADAGIDNLTGRKYALPLGGRYWVGDTKGNTSVPGMGRSIYTGLTFQFGCVARRRAILEFPPVEDHGERAAAGAGG
jgi:iron complex outermembrane receptor protein